MGTSMTGGETLCPICKADYLHREPDGNQREDQGLARPPAATQPALGVTALARRLRAGCLAENPEMLATERDAEERAE